MWFKWTKQIPIVVAVCAVATAIAGCNSGDVRNDGVDDVGQACVIRAGWKNLQTPACIDCRAAVVSPPCDCTQFREFSGRCEVQMQETRSACAVEIEDCVRACALDCTCLSACYDANAACREAAGGRDGCLTDTCSKVCQ